MSKITHYIRNGIAALALTSSCGIVTDQTPDPELHLCEANFVLPPDKAGLGRHRLGQPDIEDVPANFDYYNNHRGGVGDILAIIGCNNSVFMAWAYDTLELISVRNPTNHTSNGLALGDPMSHFFELYPDTKRFEQSDPYMPQAIILESGRLRANVDPTTETITILELNRGFFKYEGDYLGPSLDWYLD